MSLAPEYPTELAEALAAIGLADILDNFVARSRVGTRYLEIERAAARFGYEFRHEHGNLYGRLRLVRDVATPAPKLRVITRSDEAARCGSRRAI